MHINKVTYKKLKTLLKVNGNLNKLKHCLIPIADELVSRRLFHYTYKLYMLSLFLEGELTSYNECGVLTKGY